MPEEELNNLARIGQLEKVPYSMQLMQKMLATARTRLQESLSEILCLRHSMTYRSIYAKQEEAGGSRHDGVAVDPQ